MAGKIISVNVKVGDTVAEDDVIFVLESMKMENPIVTPVAGTVAEIGVSEGQMVQAGTVAAIIDC